MLCNITVIFCRWNSTFLVSMVFVAVSFSATGNSSATSHAWEWDHQKLDQVSQNGRTYIISLSLNNCSVSMAPPGFHINSSSCVAHLLSLGLVATITFLNSCVGSPSAPWPWCLTKIHVLPVRPDIVLAKPPSTRRILNYSVENTDIIDNFAELG